MNLFPKACGVSAPLRLWVGDSERQVTRPYALIGRDPRADIVLDDPEVRRLQGYVQAINGRLFCVSLGGNSGIRWDNGQRANAGWLDRDQTIWIGSTPIRIAGGAGEGGAETRASRDSRNALTVEYPGPPAVLEISRGSSEGATGASGGTSIRLVGRVLSLVGRAAECDVALSHPSLSTFHCALLWTSMGLWVVDLLGSGGVTVNGVRVRSARLNDGDEWSIGNYSIRVRFDAQVRSRTPAGISARIGAGMETPALEYNPPPGPAALAASGPSRNRPQSFPLATARSTPAEQPPAPVTKPPFDPETALSEWAPPENDVMLSSMLLMMNQFGMLQQRKLDQFLHSMMSKIEDSTSVIREEQEAIRKDLESLRGLAEDFGRVKIELSSLRSTLDAKSDFATIPLGGDGRGGLSSAGPRAESDPNGDFYDWLSRRVETLQDEHQTLWRKILNSMMGRAPNENATP